MNQDCFQFRFTATQRTKESARYFAVGLFGRQTSDKVWFPVPIEHDYILRVNHYNKIINQMNKYFDLSIFQFSVL